jgi:hypothetical protein
MVLGESQGDSQARYIVETACGRFRSGTFLQVYIDRCVCVCVCVFI